MRRKLEVRSQKSEVWNELTIANFALAEHSSGDRDAR